MMGAEILEGIKSLTIPKILEGLTMRGKEKIQYDMFLKGIPNKKG